MRNLAGKDILTERVILEIIRREMCLEESQTWVGDTNTKIPADTRLYVVARMVDAQPISSESEFIPENIDGNPAELQQYIVCENIQIDIFSRNPDLLARRWEIVGALSSIYSKQKQEEYSFKIFRLPKNFVNTSGVEGGSNIIRYSATFAANVWYKKEKVLQSPHDYFDAFGVRVDDEVSIGTPTGIIEFTID
jgi:hypothetical protein